MQKITLLLFAMVFSVSYAFAEMSTPTEAGEPAAPQAQNTEEKSANQKQIVQLMESDMTFEREKRQLSNEVALEKLRAELKKVRSEGGPAIVMSAAPEAASAPAQSVRDAVPQVLATSQVGGISKIAVGTGSRVILVDRHEVFDIGGKKYHLLNNSKKQLVVGVVAP
ncbi:hypothetical protein [Citrobacter meridianamericanus]|uniref:hypothetical protein n=1 Tax=Citrobacter meridianamericanus TaxID=2894201 RepID=UPI00351D6EE8